MKDIGDKIRYLRDKAGYTQTYLAKRLGISRSAVNAWEMSLSVPSLANVVEIATIFNVSTDYLLYDSKKVYVDITNLNGEEQEIVIRLVSYLNSNKEESLQ